MNFIHLASLIGGIGLFLLGMRLMTEGLKYAAGKSLRTILMRSTETPLRGIATGAFLTGLVQSSSAVTVATIGFVNAGLVDIGHALSLIYGCNIGTTITGWLVSLIGFKFSIKAFALPAVGFGMFLRLFKYESRLTAMGDFLAGFGIFFMGIDVLKSTFAGVGENMMHLVATDAEGLGAAVIFIAFGFLLTLFMRSSSAAIAIILTATAGGVVDIYDAAAMVIGANVGTTSTAALAVIGATPNAKRLAGAHVIFNVFTAFIALLLLPFLLDFLKFLTSLTDISPSDTTMLALFHTTFNVLGVLILFPLTGRLVTFLNGRFHTAEEDEAQPRYLDHTVLSTPVLALHALAMELRRIGAIARRMAKGAISSESGPSPKLKADRFVLRKLVAATADFGRRMQRSHLPEDLYHQLPNAIRVSGYYNDVAELAMDIAKMQEIKTNTNHESLELQIVKFKKNTVQLLNFTDNDRPDYAMEKCRERLEDLKDEYRQLKAHFLKDATKGILTAGQLVRNLDLIARIRRVAEQAEKGARYLSDLDHVEEELADENGNSSSPVDGHHYS